MRDTWFSPPGASWTVSCASLFPLAVQYEVLGWQLITLFGSQMLLLVTFTAVLVRLEGPLNGRGLASHWIVLLQPERDELSPNESTVYSASGEATDVGPPGSPYEAVAMKHSGCQWESCGSHSGGCSLVAGVSLIIGWEWRWPGETPGAAPLGVLLDVYPAWRALPASLWVGQMGITVGCLRKTRLSKPPCTLAAQVPVPPAGRS